MHYYRFSTIDFSENYGYTLCDRSQISGWREEKNVLLYRAVRRQVMK